MLSDFLVYLSNLFSFDDSHPLLFTQFHFWAFFLFVYIGFCLIVSVGEKRSRRKLMDKPTGQRISRARRLWRNGYLFLVSLFFYYKTSGEYVVLLAFATVVGYFLGMRFDHLAQKGPATKRHRFWLMVLGVVVNLGVLCYFKYAYFFTDIFNTIASTHYSIANAILLPVGISFFTFQNISYIVDVYKGKVQHADNILDFGFYTTFFPQLVAGPIIRADQFIPQLYKPFFLSRRQFGIAVFWIMNGLFKKLILSDYLAVSFVDRVFENPLLYTSFENFSALLIYSLQVYADFSGYTDIAIGVAMLMGFYLPKNFNSPYKATNPAGFWKRWHISLSNWLKDYLYIPLGGNRNSTPGTFIIPSVMLAVVALMAKTQWVTITAISLVLLLALVYWVFPRHRKTFATNLNNFDTMLLGGMWHGASFNFITWGALNGLGILVYKNWKKAQPLLRILIIFTLYAAVNLANLYYPCAVLSMFDFALMIIAAGIIFLELWGIISRAIHRKSGKTLLYSGTYKVWNVLLTFLFISFTRLFFRSGSNLDPAEANEVAWRTATQMVERIGSQWNWQQVPDILNNYAVVFITFLVGMIIHWLPERFKRRYRLWFAQMPIPLMLLVVVLGVFVVYQFITADLQPFIYFQF
ncbi:MAG: MBOAT family protein [Bacteroidales bacterium]|nr:MBOAT family protein [Bacteroidales bacterium]